MSFFNEMHADSIRPSCRQTPVFGDPFRFGKPLVFDRAAVTDTRYGALEGTSLQIQSGISTTSAPPVSVDQLHQSSSRKQPGAKGKERYRVSRLATAVFTAPGKQQCDGSGFVGAAAPVSPSAGNRGEDSSAYAASVSATPNYYLGSLGAALAHGLAPPAAAAAALAATAGAAARLALSSQVPCRGHWDLTSACTSGGRASTHNRPQLPCGGQSAQLGPAAMAATIAASAACNGCPGCRMMLQRLQTCSQCSNPKQLSSAGSGIKANSSSAGDLASRNKTSDIHTGGKLKACEVEDTPGPGQYDVPSSFGQGAAYSIGSKTAPTAATNSSDNIPGPGSYYNPAGPSAGGGPAFSLGGRWRDPGQDAAAPGPGEHQQLTYIVDGPAFTISSKRGGVTRAARSSSPGPGAYAPDWDTHRSAEGPAYSMGGRVSEPITRPASPGPAEYQQTTFRPEGPAYSFPAKRKRSSSSASTSNDGPAPTDYNAASSAAASSKVKAAPAYSFSGKQTPAVDQMFKELIPGPGSYHVSDVGPSGPAFSMGSRSDKAKENTDEAAEEPGPGEYHMETVLGSSGPAFSLAGKPNRPKAAPESDALRGPGMYYNPQAEAALQGGKAFTIGARLAVGKAAAGQDSPGPASYSLPVEQLGPAITIAGRPQVQDKGPDSPGPASYALRPTLPEGPCFTMGSKPHERPAADEDGPAVGEYEVVDTAGMEAKGPAWTLGARRAAAEDKHAADMPGPGQYHAGAASSSGPAWSMAEKWDDPAADPEAAAAVTPGPGEHHQPGWSSLGGPAFTLAGKAVGSDPQGDTPGPGAYLAGDYKGPAEADAPAYTMGSRPAPQQPADNLGPGTFDLPELAKGPAFTLGVRHIASTTGDGNATPGPAAYDTNGAATALDAAAPAWTMGQRPKEQPAGGATPAPGDYEAADPSAAAAPAWTMGARTAAADAAAAALDQQLQPGPGYYTPSDPVRDDRGPSFSIGGKWKEVEGGGGAGPAPGEYDMPAADSGPAFTLAGRAPVPGPDSAALPAPGQYHKPSQPGAETPAYTIAGRLAAGSDAAAAAAADVGPGSYDVTAAYDAAAVAAPAFTLAGKGRSEGYAAAVGADSPGVGAYEVVDTGTAGPAYSIGVRLPVAAKVGDGPSCVDYNPEGVVTSMTPSAPAYTIGTKPVPPTNPEDGTPAPGTYHGPATAGGAPSAPAAPAYSMQGKARKGKSRLRQMLGRLAELDASEPGPGEHQPTAGGSTAVSGPHFSFGPPVVPSDGAKNEGQGAAQTQSLAQLQAQLARLLLKETKRAAHKANKAAAAAAVQPGEINARNGACSGSNLQQQQQPRGKLGSSTGGTGGSTDLASISASVKHAVLLSKSQRSKAAASSCSRHKITDYTSPAPGDHHIPAAETSFGTSGPAYTMGARGKDSNRTSVADADGFAAVMAAAAAADREAAVPGPGAYHVEKPSPNPEGKVVYKPILKKHSSGGSNKKVSFSGEGGCKP